MGPTLRLLNALNSEDRGLKVRFSLATIAIPRARLNIDGLRFGLAILSQFAAILFYVRLFISLCEPGRKKSPD